MNILIAGGLGFESELIEKLSEYPLTLNGSLYSLKREEFIIPRHPSLFVSREFITHTNNMQLLYNDLYIDISGSLKSVFTLNDYAVKLGRKTIFLFYNGRWKLFVGYHPQNCLSCFMSYHNPLPQITYPAVPIEEAVSLIRQTVTQTSDQCYLQDVITRETTMVLSNPDCPCKKGKFLYLNGEMADIVSVSCGEESVAITPIHDRTIDLEFYQKILANHIHIEKQNPFFIEFTVSRYTVILFKQGRMVVKGTKEKNTALYIYRLYVGS